MMLLMLGGWLVLGRGLVHINNIVIDTASGQRWLVAGRDRGKLPRPIVALAAFIEMNELFMPY